MRLKEKALSETLSMVAPARGTGFISASAATGPTPAQRAATGTAPADRRNCRRLKFNNDLVILTWLS
jgi:hypothetical protein